MRPIAALFSLLVFLAASCSPKIKIDVVGGFADIREHTVAGQKDGPLKVAVIDVEGLIADTGRPGLLGPSRNPVDQIVMRLSMAGEDGDVRAVILRINSPGGTVAASDMLYREISDFRNRTGKPVVVSMGEVAASGGYYIALASDRIIAEPTTITGSIGVVIPTLNFSEGLNRIGIRARTLTSGPNKDLANPLEPMEEGQYAVLMRMVDDFYARFRTLVVDRRPALAADRIDELTDGRVLTGSDALAAGLVDQTGGIREAFTEAKSLAGITHARLIKYADEDRPPGSVYGPSATMAPNAGTTQINVLQLSVPSLNQIGSTSGFYYLWIPPGW